MTFDCKKCHARCEAKCCKSFPMPRDVYERNRHRMVRNVTAEAKWGDKLITPTTTSGYCPFLTPDLRCNIYNDRPPICRDYGSEEKPHLRCPWQASDGRIRPRGEMRQIKHEHLKAHKKEMKIIKKMLDDGDCLELETDYD